MERSCDFCGRLKPVVFCEADAAHLCLPCDSKVHCANALSRRHPRILICELCRNHPACARCADHQKFMCHGCDDIHHDFTSEHKKKFISTYTGCPSAKELAEEWGFDLSDLETSTLFASHIGGSSVVSSIESQRSSVSEEYEVGSSNSHIKANKRNQQYNNLVVWQQDPDLRKLQLREDSYRFSESDQEQVDASSTIDNTDWKTSDNDYQHTDFLLEGNLDEGMISRQVDQLAEILNRDSYWQSKSPVQSNQLWTQNMQDLGICDDLRSTDDLSMPDFDLTFQNYEELFKGEEEPMRVLTDGKSSTRCDPSIDVTQSQEYSCNSTATEGQQLDAGETVFIRPKDKRGSRHEKQAGYTSYQKVKPDTMKRVKSKVWKAEGADSRDANDAMTQNI